MPYTKEQARNRSELYTRILDAERIALERDVENAKQKMQESGSFDANKPIRDGNGVLLSYEDPNNLGSAKEELYEYVRVMNEQQYFNDDMLPEINKEREFKVFISENFTQYYDEEDRSGDT